MGVLHTSPREMGYFMAAATILFSISLASASDVVDGKSDAFNGEKPAEMKSAAPAKTDAGSDSKSGKAETKEIAKARKSVTRRHARKVRKEEPPYDARLTTTKVMELLKTTRDFSGRNLSGLRLVGLDLSGCSFRGADLSGADMERANLNEAVLERTDLSGANMRMTDLRLTGMRGARLDKAILDGAVWQDGIVCAKGSIGFCRER